MHKTLTATRSPLPRFITHGWRSNRFSVLICTKEADFFSLFVCTYAPLGTLVDEPTGPEKKLPASVCAADVHRSFCQLYVSSSPPTALTSAASKSPPIARWSTKPR